MTSLPAGRPVPDAADLRLLVELARAGSIGLPQAAWQAGMSQPEAAARMVAMARPDATSIGRRERAGNAVADHSARSCRASAGGSFAVRGATAGNGTIGRAADGNRRRGDRPRRCRADVRRIPPRRWRACRIGAHHRGQRRSGGPRLHARSVLVPARLRWQDPAEGPGVRRRASRAQGRCRAGRSGRRLDDLPDQCRYRTQRCALGAVHDGSTSCGRRSSPLEGQWRWFDAVSPRRLRGSARSAGPQDLESGG